MRKGKEDGMESRKYIFVVVTYRNTEDIIELLESISKSVSDYKTIIVNNFFDEDSKKRFEEIALQYDCDFINCENRGYGAGNNEGIRLALQKYRFEYLIVSNPDIVIQKFPEDILARYTEGVIGCEIYNLNHKKQNPMLVSDNRLAVKMLYEGLRDRNSKKMFLGKAINKAVRVVGSCLLRIKSWKHRKVYQIHGSFLIFTYDALEKIGAPYDEEMFLFAEEGYLAYLLKQNHIASYYCPEIEVLHKEDGSMKFRNDINEEARKASIYFFKKYYFK